MTALGRTLREPLNALGQWAEKHIEDVMAARDSYDTRLAPIALGSTVDPG
jgi:DNA-binding HxlR family transcriptional regulator